MKQFWLSLWKLISPEVFLASMRACERGIFKNFLDKKINKTQKS
jgi:hypothetical protein